MLYALKKKQFLPQYFCLVFPDQYILTFLNNQDTFTWEENVVLFSDQNEQ